MKDGKLRSELRFGRGNRKLLDIQEAAEFCDSVRGRARPPMRDEKSRAIFRSASPRREIDEVRRGQPDSRHDDLDQRRGTARVGHYAGLQSRNFVC